MAPTRPTTRTAWTPSSTPDWSPDGTQLTFFRYVEGVAISTQADIFVMNADGSNPTNITNTDTEELEPARSPDGDRLVFSATRVCPRRVVLPLGDRDQRPGRHERADPDRARTTRQIGRAHV